uniref:RING-type E3 ubiquitin transferase n=1 Tax=Eptatretus burgeri TaxID=7764 RepID=A0A8C4QK07_EPTBU
MFRPFAPCFTGTRKWLHWRRELELLSDLSYFGLTTLVGNQTLGEEYAGAVQVEAGTARVPSAWRRLLFVILHVIVPYMLDRVLARFERALLALQERQDADPMSFLRFTGPVSRYSSLPWPGSYLRSILGRAWPWLLGSSAVGAERDNSLQIVQTLRQFLSSLHQLHMSVFYIHGTYYHVAKRLAGIRYVLLHGSPLETKAVRRAYTLLGLFSLFHLALMLWRHLLLLRGFQRMRQSWTLHRSAHRGTPSSSTQSGRIARCPLCLEARQHATATPCGHIFCWECIASWTSTKAECPLCREKVQPQRLIFLRNFR